MTWSDRANVHLLPIGAASAARTQRARRDPSGTAVVGAGAGCVVAWTHARGARAEILRVESCAARNH